MRIIFVYFWFDDFSWCWRMKERWIYSFSSMHYFFWSLVFRRSSINLDCFLLFFSMFVFYGPFVSNRFILMQLLPWVLTSILQHTSENCRNKIALTYNKTWNFIEMNVMRSHSTAANIVKIDWNEFYPLQLSFLSLLKNCWRQLLETFWHSL